MRILVVDDDPVCVDILAGFLTEMGYETEFAMNGEHALDLIRNGDFRIVLTDWQMPEMSGLELCREIRQRQFCAYVYIILLTSLTGHNNLIQGLRAGADDFLTKPFDPDELRVRLRAAERVVLMENRDLVIFALAKLAESRDPETGAHLERVREYCRILADELSRMDGFSDQIDSDYVRTLYITSPLHDIGKVGIPDNVLLKPGRLTEEEFEIMKQHTVIGGETLDELIANHPSADLLRFASEIAWSHHERYDGSGYPRQIAGDDIPLCGRILTLADVYDALTTKRVYKPAFSHSHAKNIILEGRGTMFDPSIVDAFLQREPEFLEINKRLSDASQADDKRKKPYATVAEKLPNEPALDQYRTVNPTANE